MCDASDPATTAAAPVTRSPECLDSTGSATAAGSCGTRQPSSTGRSRSTGLRIGTGIHLEPKTAALLLTLQRGGAEVVSTGNLNSTQAETVDYLREHGITVIGGPTADPVEHDRHLRGVLATEAGPHPGQRWGSVRALSRGPVREPRGRDRGDDIRARPAAAPPGPDRQTAHRDQRQPDQAIRREHPRRRAGHGRGVHAHHQPDHERPSRDRVRLRLGRAWRRDVLPQLLLDGVRRGAAAGPPVAGRPGRDGGSRSRGRGPLVPTSSSRSPAPRTS